MNLNILNEFQLKCSVIDGAIVDVLRKPILYSFVLDKPPRYELFSEPEMIHCKIKYKSVLDTITFYSEGDNHEKNDFNGETLTFTLELIKIWTTKLAFKTSK